MIKFLTDMIKNPDGSYSTKRVFAWIGLFFSIIFAFLGILKPDINEGIFITIFTTFMASSLGALGISSYDNSNYYKNGNRDTKPGINHSSE